MHQVYVRIVLSTILEEFESEVQFYTEQLAITEKNWLDWKEGQVNLSAENLQKIKNLFTDYEWLVLQKVLRQTILFPEKRNTAVQEYRHIKTAIAKKWLAGDLAEVELIAPAKESPKVNPFINIRVTVKYGEWGYDDILSFRLPSMIQQQIEKAEVPLLDWVNENLVETYTKDDEAVS
ncbi:hypothetical protein [Enterococcus sp. HY326]|uniref:hypothetical protein n=1 Tax=Enterococcus sp. HY326 TaxID=2971265 RepID=UPI00223F89ED|nr:hypothetical protein [Enterococcus sp. HY326]